VNGRQPQFILQMEGNLNLLRHGHGNFITLAFGLKKYQISFVDTAKGHSASSWVESRLA
jgi:hypothetical protein